MLLLPLNPSTVPDYYHGNTIVEQLNVIAQGEQGALPAACCCCCLLSCRQQSSFRSAAEVTAAAGLPYLDLYHHITAYCGSNYSSWWGPGVKEGQSLLPTQYASLSHLQ